MPVSVHPAREQGVDVHDAAAFADLQPQRVRAGEGIGPGVERPGPERLYLLIQIPGHLTGDADSS